MASVGVVKNKKVCKKYEEDEEYGNKLSTNPSHSTIDQVNIFSEIEGSANLDGIVFEMEEVADGEGAGAVVYWKSQLVIPTFNSKLKVNQTNLVLLADEHVSELDVDVSDAVVMKIEKTVCDLFEDDRCFSHTNQAARSAIQVRIKRIFASPVHDQINLKKLEKIGKWFFLEKLD